MTTPQASSGIAGLGLQLSPQAEGSTHVVKLCASTRIVFLRGSWRFESFDREITVLFLPLSYPFAIFAISLVLQDLVFCTAYAVRTSCNETRPRPSSRPSSSTFLSGKRRVVDVVATIFKVCDVGLLPTRRVSSIAAKSMTMIIVSSPACSWRNAAS